MFFFLFSSFFVRHARPERTDHGSLTSSFCNQFFIDNTNVLSMIHPAGKLGDIFSKAWFGRLLREATSFRSQERFVHHTIGRIALGLEETLPEPLIASIDGADVRARETASSPCKTWSRLFRKVRVHYQPRVVRECRRRRPGSQTSRSRPPRTRGSRGSRHLSHWRGFSDVFLHVHAKSCTHTRCVTSRWTDSPWTISVGHCHDRPLLQRCDFSTGCIVRHAPATALEFKSGKIPTFFPRDSGCFRIHTACVFASKSYILDLTG